MMPDNRLTHCRARSTTTAAIGLLAVGASLLVLSGCAQQASEEVATSAAVPVTVQPVRRGDIQAMVTVTGIVAPAPGADLIIVAPQAARIAEMPKAEGDHVRNGDLLVRFQIPSLDAEIAARRADVTKAQAQLRNAKAALAERLNLFDRGVAARKEVEDAQRDLADAEAALGGADAAVHAATLLAARTVVRAQFDGVVARRWHNPGDLVDAASTDPVLRLIDPRRLEAQAAVPVGDLPSITQGAGAHIHSPAGASTTGTVVNRPVMVDSSNATASVRVALTPGSNLAAGTPVRIEILTNLHHNALILPASALVREGPDSFVYVVGSDAKAHRRPVVVALVSGNNVEVETGVAPGDQIITRGQAALPDGASVAVDR